MGCCLVGSYMPWCRNVLLKLFPIYMNSMQLQSICVISMFFFLFQAQNTVKCVCELMQVQNDMPVVSCKNLNKSPLDHVNFLLSQSLSFFSIKLKHFWRKMQSNQVQMSIYGICSIDRGILTSVKKNLWNCFSRNFNFILF